MTTSGVPPHAPSPDGLTPPPRRRGQVATYGVGRTCADRACTTTLSRYNAAPLCWQHAQIAYAAEHRGRA